MQKRRFLKSLYFLAVAGFIGGLTPAHAAKLSVPASGSCIPDQSASGVVVTSYLGGGIVNTNPNAGLTIYCPISDSAANPRTGISSLWVDGVITTT